MFYIIDGYNLLHSINKGCEDDEVVSDIAMCRIIGAYLYQTRENGRIVFDGIGPPEKIPFENVRNTEVVFSGERTDADTVIENQIAASSAPKNTTIVSSDRRLRDAARARKAVSLKSDEFWHEVIKQVTKKQGPKEPPAKRTGITSSEAELWLEEFGLE